MKRRRANSVRRVDLAAAVRPLHLPLAVVLSSAVDATQAIGPLADTRLKTQCVRKLRWWFGDPTLSLEDASEFAATTATKFPLWLRALLDPEAAGSVRSLKLKEDSTYDAIERFLRCGLILKRWRVPCQSYAFNEEKHILRRFYDASNDAEMGLRVRAELSRAAGGRLLWPTQHVALVYDAAVLPTGDATELAFVSIHEDAGKFCMDDALALATVPEVAGLYVQALFTLEALAALGLVDDDRHLGNIFVVPAAAGVHADRTWAYDVGSDDGTVLCVPPPTHANRWVLMIDYDNTRVEKDEERATEQLRRSMAQMICYCPPPDDDAASPYAHDVTNKDRVARCTSPRFNVFNIFPAGTPAEPLLRELLVGIPRGEWLDSRLVREHTVRWCPGTPLPPILASHGEPVLVGYMPPLPRATKRRKKMN